ncbi:hypothetical protein ACFSO9_09930 [Mesonia maritima]|uniref:hypothetical protein n=1 Tax=Mesonia maritima TaxID=1793873 RepID=UPI0036285884
MKLIKIYASLIVFFLSLSTYSQYGVIEMKNGDRLEVADGNFLVENEQLRYYKEKVESKGFSLFGIRSKKQKQEYLDKTNAVNIDDIKVIHTQGELFVGNKKIANYSGIRYIKIKRKYQEFYVIENDKCSLLIKNEGSLSNAIFSYYVQEDNKEPYIIHKSGTGLGPKYKRRSKNILRTVSLQ